MISLCMIVRDEEDVLERCLESVRGLFDETVIVDTGSTDRTKSIAERFTDKVYDFKWEDDFSKARNFAFSKASGDYLCWLDADDVIEGDNYGLFGEIIDSLERLSPDMVMLPYNVAFSDDGRVLLSYERERIVRAGAGFWFEGEIHEAIVPRGKIIHGRAAVSHKKLKEGSGGRNIAIFEKIIENGRGLSPRMRYYYARELCAVGRRDEAIKQYRLCAEDSAAWSENRISAFYELSQCLSAAGRDEESEEALYRALSLGPPRADLCCELGRRALEKGRYDLARFWYELAPRQFKTAVGGFVHADYGGYVPYLQLCVIADRLGERELAEKYNDLAGKIYPRSAEVLHNREYFAGLRASEREG